MKVLITGGAGSLGRAFVELLHKDHELIVLDGNEWALASLRAAYPGVRCVLGQASSVTDWDFSEVQAALHLAAYKHVDLGEENPLAMIDNNVSETRVFLREMAMSGVPTLFMSTDKAVEPCSAYGYSKALGETIARHYGLQIARMGNILESTGSVIPVWDEQIRLKRPLSITDPEMTRWTIEAGEAARQLWEGFRAEHRLIVPDCGEPIPLLGIAERTLQRHGYASLSDYPPGYEVIGRRRGEKTHERMTWEGEEYNK